jgi:putrescine---pyruvate transaminase
MTTTDDHTPLWHPFADLSKVDGCELTLTSGDGVWVADEEGKRYLDATAALWYCNVGHGRQRLADAAREQMMALAGYQIFETLANQPALRLAERICTLAGLGPGSAAFLTSGGSDGVETAAKIARRYWRLQGAPERELIIARASAYHGMHGFGTALAGIEANAVDWGVNLPGIIHVPRDDVAALEQVLDEHRGRVAAFFGEPVQCAGGVYPPTPTYWRDVQDLCRADDVLVVADEVVTGYGRLGEWFGSHRLGIEPDLMITAKGLSSGYLPVGAVIAAPGVVAAFRSEQAGVFRHGYTYSGHPAACAVALENLDLLEEEDLVRRVADLEKPFCEAFSSLADHPLVEEVRAFGLLAGLQLREDAIAAGGLAATVDGLRASGVLTRALVGHSIQFSPAFIITESEIEWLVERIVAALDGFAGKLAPPPVST